MQISQLLGAIYTTTRTSMHLGHVLEMFKTIYLYAFVMAGDRRHITPFQIEKFAQQ